MMAIWIAVAAGGLIVVGVTGRMLRAKLLARPPRAVIANLANSTSVDPSGAVRSVQRADLMLAEADLAQIWTPAHLERLARTYWRFLARATLGVIRVQYTPAERSVVLLVPQLKLLIFQAPEYEMDATRGLVRWEIARGLLVSRRGRNGRGYLQIEVQRGQPDGRGRAVLHVEVEVANFYPSIASRLSRRIYNATQSRIHVIVTYGFLRSLARLDLAESRVGRFAAQG